MTLDSLGIQGTDWISRARSGGRIDIMIWGMSSEQREIFEGERASRENRFVSEVNYMIPIAVMAGMSTVLFG
jgi:hypothetical protein